MATLSNSGNKELSGSQIKQSQGRDMTMVPGSNIELKEPVVEFADMKQEYKEFCFQIADEAFRTWIKGTATYPKHMAEMIKNALDEKFGGSWHVSVGKSFFLSFLNIFFFK